MVVCVPDDLQDLERQLRSLNETVIRHISQFNEWRRSVDAQLERSEERNTRAPVLLFAAISAATGAVSVLVQIWLSGK